MRRTIAATIAFAALAVGTARGQLTVTCGISSGPVEVRVPYTTMLCSVSGLLPLLPYTWQIGPLGTNLPDGLTLQVSGDTSTATISGTPTTPGAYDYQLQVTDSTPILPQSGFIEFSGTIQPAVTVTTTTLPGGTVGVAYPPNTMLQASGGIQPYSWSIASGNLPPGLNLDPPTGTIYGTPQTAGTFPFTATVTDGADNTGSGLLSITVVLPPLTMGCVPTTGPTQAGVFYSAACSAAGGMPGYTWSISSGTLPANLALSATTGANVTISGTPAAAGIYNYTVTVTDTTPQSASQMYSGTIAPATLSVTTTSLPNGTIGVAYPSGTDLQASGGTTPYTWSISSGSLPTNLALSPNGAITGTPTTIETSNFTALVTDSGSPPQTATKALSITIQPVVLAIGTSSPLPSGAAGMPYNAALSGSGGVPPYSWSVLAGGGILPAGLSLNPSSGAITGTPTTAGIYTFTIQLSDSASTTPATKQFNITITNLAIGTPPALPNATLGVPYSETLTATGGTPPYSWAVTSGGFPAALSLNPTTGAITGTPTTAGGPFTFTVAVTDSTPQQPATVAKTFSLTIVSALVIITGPILPTGSVGVAYSQTLTATGGTAPYTWSIVEGALPAPLSLDPNSGAITGTPATASTTSFTVQAKDSTGDTATKAFTLTIAASLAIATPSPLISGEAAVAYSQTLAVVGGTPPYVFSVSGGGLPPGLTLSAGGALAGTPTTAGTFSFTAEVVDHNSLSATKGLTITILAALGIATPATLNGGSLNSIYSVNLSPSGGMAPYTWTLASGALPVGLALSGAGAITGTPTAAGTFTFTAQVADALSATASRQFTITIASGLAIASPATLPGGTAGAAYSVTLLASGGTAPYTWVLTGGSLPAGLSLAEGGLLSGTLQSAGTSTFTVQVTDSAGTHASGQLTIVVTAPLSITTTSLPGGKKGVAYSQTLTAAGGTPPYTFSLSSGSLPPGISIAAGGLLSGTPTASGSYSFGIQVTDSASATATQSLTLVIAGLAITTTGALPTAALGTPYSVTLTASGGTSPYQWTIVEGASALPAGLTLDASKGTISGTPTAAGNFTGTLQVTDSTKAIATEAFTLMVLSEPAASFSGIPATASPDAQLSGSLTLASEYPADLGGEVQLTFQPNASLTAPADDPAVQFSGGGRAASFTIKAGSTAPFDFSLQTGTVAGTITLTVSWSADGVTLAAPAGLTQTIQIAPSAPVITKVTATATSSGFQVEVTGYSTTREVTQADLQFTAASGQSLETTSLNVSLTSAASAWFQSSASDAYGSQFIVTLPFTVTNGGASAIASVSVQLVNSQGTSNSVSAGL